MTTIPAHVRTYTQLLTAGTPGLRIPYVSLADTMQNCMYGMKSFLLANGCSHVWSASAGTGSGERCGSHRPHHERRGVDASRRDRRTSQAWCVILDGNGGHLLLAWTGGTDDVGYIGYSPGALYTLAATTNQRPTATDEYVIANASGGTTLRRRHLDVWRSHSAWSDFVGRQVVSIWPFATQRNHRRDVGRGDVHAVHVFIRRRRYRQSGLWVESRGDEVRVG
jgi:hypothetical protein